MVQATNLQGASIVVVGRLERIGKRRLSTALQSRQATLSRRIKRTAGLLVIAHGAVRMLPSSRLESLLREADARTCPVISEHAFLRRLALLPPLPQEPRAHGLSELAARAGLPRPVARLLGLFDIIEGEDERYSFRDLRAAREIGLRLARDGDLAATLENALALRRRNGYRHHFAEVGLRAGEDQSSLPLDGDTTRFDEVWDAGVEAAAEGDAEGAAERFRRCVAMRPRQAPPLLGLGRALIAIGQETEARQALQRAVTLDPSAADAWHELAAMESGGAKEHCLERALAADANYLPALHDLAALHLSAQRYDRALPLWQRFLERAQGSGASVTAPAVPRGDIEQARRAVMLCRMARLQARAEASDP